MKLSVQLEPLLYMLRQSSFKAIILNAISQLQANGVSAITFPLSEELLDKISEDWYRIFRSACQVYTIIHMPPDDELMRVALKLKPNMVVFGEKFVEDTYELEPLQPPLLTDWLKETKLNLDANHISMGLKLFPQANLLKTVQKIQIDWLEFPIHSLLECEDTNDLILKIEDFANATLMARKLGMGVTLSGDIKLTDMFTLQEIKNTDEVLLNFPFWEQSILYGIDKTLEMYRYYL